MINTTRETCPICDHETLRRPRITTETPYFECQCCGFWTQLQLKAKVYEAFHEAPGDTVSWEDKEVNFQIAGFLYLNYLYERLEKSEKVSALDIGAKFPWLMHSLSDISRGSVQTWAIDGIPDIEKYCQQYNLHVTGVQYDFEANEGLPYPWKDVKFDLITMIHMIEHLYTPMESLSRVRNLLKPGGIFFIRCPASDVEGIERDFTPGHYDIHPQVWNKKSLEMMAAILGFQIISHNALVPGQRDLFLRKI